uniref:Mannosyl-oligosaccharide glucosidase n=2 Tax=Culex pipiens TaxID=7175 RepID=A0A8D8G110_CULPI
MSHHPSRKPPVRPNRRAAAAAAAAKAPVQASTDWKKIGFTGVGLVILTAVAAVVYQGYLETRVVTPYSQKKLAAASFDTKMLWGSYRPGIYFGLSTREEHPLATGLMWYFPKELRQLSDIRHLCEIGDNLKQYGWTAHDGRNFGVQHIQDGPVLLETSFVKDVHNNAPSWTAKVDVRTGASARSSRDTISLLWYVAFESDDDGFIGLSQGGDKLPTISAFSPTAGQLSVKFSQGGEEVQEVTSVCVEARGFNTLKETIVEHLKVHREGESMSYYLLDKESRMNCSLVAVLVTVRTPTTLLIHMNSGYDADSEILTEKEYDQSLERHVKKFSRRFSNTFKLQEKGFNGSQIGFAEAALSNMVGGIGYFYGASKVKGEHNENPINYWKAPLYTAVPSRSFFPRGFLWDEGFHGLLISSWDIDIALDIMTHWLDLMNVDGWIPREQILGSEALAKVPAEFVVQHNKNANPPTMFLELRYLLNNYQAELLQPGRNKILNSLLPRLQAWHSWFNTTQLGTLSGSYQWKGRTVTPQEINPKTLTSGLDDFPRASHPDGQERHVDLLCWMALASQTIADLQRFLGKDDTKYRAAYEYLSDTNLLDSLHLSTTTNTYADYGLHTDKVTLKRYQFQQEEKMLREVLDQPKYRYVDSVFGYVNLFPFLTKLLPPDASSLKTTLENIHNPELLWSPYGIRSLSKRSLLYMKHNTQHDPPYWRGQIWININYLILGALDHYGKLEGPHRELARRMYGELRTNLVTNLYKQYQRTGYIWENYNDSTGEGRGCYPFTGWSALVVMIMAEIY